MVKGLYAAYTGMINQQNKMDVISNNLANAATTGYKKEGSTSQAFDSVLAYKIKDRTVGARSQRIGTMNLGVKIGENYTDYTQGAFRNTDNTYDVAISGNGFFKVQFTSKSGKTSTKYTRDGSFTLNVDGYLVTKDGDYVLDKNDRRIRLDPLKTARIDEQGTIFQEGRVLATINLQNYSDYNSFRRSADGYLVRDNGQYVIDVNGQRIPINSMNDLTIDDEGRIYTGSSEVATIGLQDFEDYNYLEHYGENYYQPVEGYRFRNATGQIVEGYLEASNVQVVSEMVEMISVTRTYESNQKIIQTIDGTLDKAVNQLGNV